MFIELPESVFHVLHKSGIFLKLPWLKIFLLPILCLLSMLSAHKWEMSALLPQGLGTRCSFAWRQESTHFPFVCREHGEEKEGMRCSSRGQGRQGPLEQAMA